MLVALIADTHLPRGNRRLPDSCLDVLRAADLIVHAGDFSHQSVLADLRELGPVAAVHGNVDSAELRRELPESISLELENVVLGVIHDAGPSEGRLQRLRARFPDADAVVFGHSHMPLHEEDDELPDHSIAGRQWPEPSGRTRMRRTTRCAPPGSRGDRNLHHPRRVRPALAPCHDPPTIERMLARARVLSGTIAIRALAVLAVLALLPSGCGSSGKDEHHDPGRRRPRDGSGDQELGG